MEIKKTSHARYELWYHLAFGTKYRRQVFNDDKTREEVALLFREIALQYDLEENEFYTCPCGCGYSQKEPGKCPQCTRELEKKPE